MMRGATPRLLLILLSLLLVIALSSGCELFSSDETDTTAKTDGASDSADPEAEADPEQAPSGPAEQDADGLYTKAVACDIVEANDLTDSLGTVFTDSPNKAGGSGKVSTCTFRGADIQTAVVTTNIMTDAELAKIGLERTSEILAKPEGVKREVVDGVGDGAVLLDAERNDRLMIRKGNLRIDVRVVNDVKSGKDGLIEFGEKIVSKL